MAKKSVMLYPCRCPEGHHLSDARYPGAAAEFPADEAAWLVATKAFSYDEDGLHTRTETHESPIWPPVEPPSEPEEAEAEPVTPAEAQG